MQIGIFNATLSGGDARCDGAFRSNDFITSVGTSVKLEKFDYVPPIATDEITNSQTSPTINTSFLKQNYDDGGTLNDVIAKPHEPVTHPGTEKSRKRDETTLLG